MNAEAATLTRFGAWWQIWMIVLAVGFWVGGISAGFLASCVGYFVVTMTGIDLPELAALHFVEFDPRSDTVRYSDPPLLLDTVLRLLAKIEEDGSD